MFWTALKQSDRVILNRHPYKISGKIFTLDLLSNNSTQSLRFIKSDMALNEPYNAI